MGDNNKELTGLSSSFSMNALPPTGRSTKELKVELVIAEVRDAVLEIIKHGDMSMVVDGKVEGLTEENAVAKLTGKDGHTLDWRDQSARNVFVHLTRSHLYSQFHNTPPDPKLVESVYNAAVQSALDVLKKERHASFEQDTMAAARLES